MSRNERNCIDRFRGAFAFLSNFMQSPIAFSGRTWPTVEHIFQAAKTLDENKREQIRFASTPAKAKQLGRKVKLRPDWEGVKQEVMLKSVRLKFKQYPELRKRLLRTGDVPLIEGNLWHDNIWGDCYCPRCRGIKGENLLGQILMKVRKEKGE